MKLSIPPGTTSKVIHIFIQDTTSSEGDGLTGLLFNSAGLVAYYIRPGDAVETAITLANIVTLGTYVSGGLKEVNAATLPGIYEFHIPDATLAAGAFQVTIMLHGAASMAPLPLEIQLGNTPSDMLAISGDSPAADNLEAMLDGTGAKLTLYSPNTEPALEVTNDGNGHAALLWAQSGAAANGLAIVSDEGDALVTFALDASKGGFISDGVNVETTLTAIVNRIGSFTGTGINTILGFFRAAMRADSAITPSDVGGTYDNETDSLEAIRDRGDAAWTSSVPAGPGAVNHTYTVTNTGTGLPIDGVEVWYTTDIAGLNVVWVGQTDTFGVARDANGNLPLLDPGTYYIWKQLSGFIDDQNPDVEVVA